MGISKKFPAGSKVYYVPSDLAHSPKPVYGIVATEEERNAHRWLNDKVIKDDVLQQTPVVAWWGDDSGPIQDFRNASLSWMPEDACFLERLPEEPKMKPLFDKLQLPCAVRCRGGLKAFVSDRAIIHDKEYFFGRVGGMPTRWTLDGMEDEDSGFMRHIESLWSSDQTICCWLVILPDGYLSFQTVEPTPDQNLLGSRKFTLTVEEGKFD